MSMTDKAKVHVFLGAPHPSSQPEGAPDKGPPRWRTIEFKWNQGRLWPKRDDSEADNESQNILQANQEPTGDSDLCPGVVAEYLDSCFLSQQTDPRPEHVNRHPITGPTMSVETEYLTVWTKSQSLLLRSRLGTQTKAGLLEMPGSPHTPINQTPSVYLSSPELYSPPVSPEERGLGGTLQESDLLFIESLSQRHQEGDMILECTPDGLLCSQVCPPDHDEQPLEKEDNRQGVGSPNTSAEGSPTPSTSKRAKLSVATCTSRKEQHSPLPQIGPTTLLSRCRSHGVRYSVLIAVVHPCHLKEIKVKSGAWAESSIPLATVVVTDQSGVEMKLVLWRAAAFWTLTVYPGDILLISDLTVHVDKWRGETVLQSSYISRQLNLGQITQGNSPQAPQSVNIHTLRALCSHLYEKRPLLASLPPHPVQDLHSIPFIRLGSLRPDMLVHALLKVKHTRMTADWRHEVEGKSRTGSMLKAVLTVEQADGSRGAVVLWGSALSWLQQIERNKDAVWEFRRLLVKQDMTSGLLELHSTPWSSFQHLSANDTRCIEFWAKSRTNKGSSSFEIDLHTLLSQKYTGDVELKVNIIAFQFQNSPSQDAVQLVDVETTLERIQDIVSGDITYTGCGLCCAELETDENGIYRPCYPCLPHTGVRRYYRPVTLTIREGESRVCVQVLPTLVQKILLNTPPDKLNKNVAPMSEERFVQVVAKRIHSILSEPRAPFHLTVRSHFDCDENNVPIVQNFLLLDVTSQEV